MDIIDVLNDSEGRDLIDALEDILSSLRGKEGDTMLEDARDGLVAELQRRFGFTCALYEGDTMQHVIIEKRADNGAVIGCYHDLDAVKSARPGIIFHQGPGEPNTSGRAELIVYRARTPDCGLLHYEVHEVRQANKCAECWAPTMYPLCGQCQNDRALAAGLELDP